MRKICWNYGGNSASVTEVASDLAAWGARQWQIEITAPILSACLDEKEALPEPVKEEATEQEGENEAEIGQGQ
ncbi:MAG: hypothetical protein F2531_05070 [Actinobacteria bacterium]|uniref:Unannotated protein n=1 Tax=freshwater metagenome TaxID=449393 RepID=A0A6J6CG19_9ZZZZ|nr:hypothetical protein [Actinomycetota bacterium]